jgi:hypothetical protein
MSTLVAGGKAARERLHAVVVEGLTKSYPGGVRALDSLSFTVEAGTIFGLLARSSPHYRCRMPGRPVSWMSTCCMTRIECAA